MLPRPLLEQITQKHEIFQYSKFSQSDITECVLSINRCNTRGTDSFKLVNQAERIYVYSFAKTIACSSVVGLVESGLTISIEQSVTPSSPQFSKNYLPALIGHHIRISKNMNKGSKNIK